MQRLALAAAISFSLVACARTPAPSTAEPAATTASVPLPVNEAAPAPSAPVSSALTGVSPGMAYATFRSKVIEQGWEPKPDPDCLTNVIGSNFKDVCAADASRCNVCRDMPELSAYSGDAQLLAYFENTTDHRILEVGGSGELGAWNQPGHEDELQVASWTVTPTAK